MADSYDVENAEDVFRRMRTQYLTAAGWKEDWDVTGTVLAWVKVMPDGRTAMSNVEKAFELERALQIEGPDLLHGEQPREGGPDG